MDTCTAVRHGTERAYRDHKCRCPEAIAMMRARWADRNQKRRGRRVRRPAGAPPSGWRGWTLNPDDYDHVAVLRAVLGDRRIRLAPAEKVEVVERLTARGWSAQQVAEHMGCSGRTVVRWRKRGRDGGVTRARAVA